MFFEDTRLTFEKINDTQLLVSTMPYEIINYVDNVIYTLSIGLERKYDGFLTQQMEDYMYSRVVSSIYVRTHKHVSNDLGFINIEVKVKDRSINITLGELNVDDKTTVLVNGVMY